MMGKGQKNKQNRVVETVVIKRAPKIKRRIVRAGKRAIKRYNKVIDRCTAAGRGFLQCAFASPDFKSGNLMGIPDGNNTAVKVHFVDHNLVGNHIGVAGKSKWYLVLPTPGVAYWSCSLDVGTFPTSTTSWDPTFYPGCFGTGSYFGDVADKRSANFSGFRYVSSIFEYKNTSNMMSYNGNITIWKTPVRQVTNMITKQVTLTVNNTATPPVAIGTVVVPSNGADVNLNGLGGTFAVPNDAKPYPVVEGCYVVATNQASEFEQFSIEEGINRLPTQDPGVGTPNMDCILNGPYLGCGGMDAIVVRVDQPTGSTPVNAAILQVWACVEYQVNANSNYYSTARFGAARDQLALNCYQAAARSMATAYTSAENSNFWTRVSAWIEDVANILALAPGPAGMLGAGVGMTISAIRRMAL